MANRIEIDIVARDNTGNSFQTVADKLRRLSGQLAGVGNMFTNVFTRPLNDIFKSLMKNEDFEAAVQPIKDAFKGVADELAQSLLPIVEDLTPLLLSIAGALVSMIDSFSKLPEPIQETALGFLAILAAVGPLLGFLAPLAGIASTLVGAFGGISAIVTGLATLAFPLLIAATIPLSATFMSLVLGVLGLAAGFYAAFMLITGQSELLKTQITNILEGIKTLFKIFVRTVLLELEKLFPGILGQINKILTTLNTKTKEFYNIGKNWMSGIISGVASKVGELIATITEAVKDAVETANALLGIKSPSKVFMKVGEKMMEGWALGISGSNAPQQALASSPVLAPEAFTGNRQGGGTTVVLNYSPAVALGDRYEAEAVLAPMIQRALRGMV